MKKLLLVLTVSLASLGALAQGKISFQTDSLHLVYFPSPFPGQGVDSAHMPPGINFLADLYIGTSSSSLSLISSTTFSAVPGKWNSLSVVVPGIPGGTSVFVTTVIRDDAFAPQPTFSFPYSPGVWGYSQEFTFTLGSSITYPPMWGSNGTWPIGTWVLDQYGTGSRGAIVVGLIPEPCAIALLGLGAAMFIFRRESSSVST
jgi:hypothetical protein